MSRKLRIMSHASFTEQNLPKSGEMPRRNTKEKLEKREEGEVGFKFNILFSL